MAMESQTFFSAANRVAPLGIVPLAGARELSEKVEAHLVRWAKRAGMDVDTVSYTHLTLPTILLV